jgi:hypothetical protein
VSLPQRGGGLSRLEKALGPTPRDDTAGTDVSSPRISSRRTNPHLGPPPDMRDTEKKFVAAMGQKFPRPELKFPDFGRLEENFVVAPNSNKYHPARSFSLSAHASYPACVRHALLPNDIVFPSTHRSVTRWTRITSQESHENTYDFFSYIIVYVTRNTAPLSIIPLNRMDTLNWKTRIIPMGL